MIKEKLIEALQKLPDGINVNLFDHRKCMHDDCGDGSHEGIYPEFEIEVIKIEEKDGLELYKERHGVPFRPWAALSFVNDDYEE